MVIEVLGAPVASLAVVAFLVSVGPTQIAVHDVLMAFSLSQVGIDDVGVDWVEHGDPGVSENQKHQ